MSERKPDFVVCGRTLDGEHWKPIGVGWRNKTRQKQGYVKIALDFMPTTRELTIWNAGQVSAKEPEQVDTKEPEEQPNEAGEEAPFR